MDLREVTDKQKNKYNKLVTHIMQSWEWGEFRKSLGTPVLRYGLFENNKLKTVFQLTLHKIPFTNYYVGYLPKGPFPDQDLADVLEKIAKEKNCAFIKIEPNIELDSKSQQLDIDKRLINSTKPLFPKHNFILDLTPNEETLLKNMSSKTRYNIKVAQKHGVKVQERTDDQAFDIYAKLHFETTKRQGFYSHTPYYHKKVWQILKEKQMATILIAFYKSKPLTAWMLFIFKDTLYYPYGGSSTEYKNVMANNLVAWETIKFGKKLNLKRFDMWGSLEENPDPKNPWIGFHNFKKGYSGKLVEYIGTYDLVLNWPVYTLHTLVDKLTPLKVFLLKLTSYGH